MNHPEPRDYDPFLEQIYPDCFFTPLVSVSWNKNKASSRLTF